MHRSVAESSPLDPQLTENYYYRIETRLLKLLSTCENLVSLLKIHGFECIDFF